MTTTPTDYMVNLRGTHQETNERGWQMHDFLLFAIAERLERLVTAVERLDKAGNFQGGPR